jgi:hypothetical protein
MFTQKAKIRSWQPYMMHSYTDNRTIEIGPGQMVKIQT